VQLRQGNRSGVIGIETGGRDLLSSPRRICTEGR
jgi:hypothetical protein